MNIIFLWFHEAQLKPEEFSALDETALSNYSHHCDAHAAVTGGGVALIIDSKLHLNPSSSTLCPCVCKC